MGLRAARGQPRLNGSPVPVWFPTNSTSMATARMSQRRSPADLRVQTRAARPGEAPDAVPRANFAGMAPEAQTIYGFKVLDDRWQWARFPASAKALETIADLNENSGAARSWTASISPLGRQFRSRASMGAGTRRSARSCEEALAAGRRRVPRGGQRGLVAGLQEEAG